MYYEINVSLLGSHYFATAKRSLLSKPETKNVLAVMLRKFPESEGYKVTLTKYEEIGNGLDIADFLKL